MQNGMMARVCVFVCVVSVCSMHTHSLKHMAHTANCSVYLWLFLVIKIGLVPVMASLWVSNFFDAENKNLLLECLLTAVNLFVADKSYGLEIVCVCVCSASFDVPMVHSACGLNLSTRSWKVYCFNVNEDLF